MLVYSVLSWLLSPLPLPSDRSDSDGGKWTLSLLKMNHQLPMCLRVSTGHLKKVDNRKCIHTNIMTSMLQLCAWTCRSGGHSLILTSSQNGGASLCFESALMLLFTVCSCCRSGCTSVSKTVIGSFLGITQSCSRCGYWFIWESQPLIGGTPAGNILTSRAILYSSVIPAKVLRVFLDFKLFKYLQEDIFQILVLLFAASNQPSLESATEFTLGGNEGTKEEGGEG